MAAHTNALLSTKLDTEINLTFVQFFISFLMLSLIILQDESCYSKVTTDRMMEKGCMSNTDCEYWKKHPENCESGMSTEPFCVTCCDKTLLCNERHKTPKLKPISGLYCRARLTNSNCLCLK